MTKERKGKLSGKGRRQVLQILVSATNYFYDVTPGKYAAYKLEFEEEIKYVDMPQMWKGV